MTFLQKLIEKQFFIYEKWQYNIKVSKNKYNWKTILIAIYIDLGYIWFSKN